MTSVWILTGKQELKVCVVWWLVVVDRQTFYSCFPVKIQTDIIGGRYEHIYIYKAIFCLPVFLGRNFCHLCMRCVYFPSPHLIHIAFIQGIHFPTPPHSYAESIFINQILLLVHRLQKGEVYFCSVSLLFCYVPQNSSNLPVTRGLVITVSNNSLSLLLFLE